MNRISNYDELVIERKKLESKIVQQRETLKNGLNDLEEKIGPFLNLLPILNICTTFRPNFHSAGKYKKQRSFNQQNCGGRCANS